MSSVRRFRPSVEFMDARIVPSSPSTSDPTGAGTSPSTSPLVNTNNLTTAPSVEGANLLIIAPTSINVTSTLC